MRDSPRNSGKKVDLFIEDKVNLLDCLYHIVYEMRDLFSLIHQINNICHTCYNCISRFSLLFAFNIISGGCIVKKLMFIYMFVKHRWWIYGSIFVFNIYALGTISLLDTLLVYKILVLHYEKEIWILANGLPF